MVNSNDQQNRLYIVVRSDIPLGLQMAQAVHAAFLFTQKHPQLVGEWEKNSQYLIIVQVPTGDHLTALSLKARNLDILHEKWQEPDLGNATTSIAFAPSSAARKLCGSLPLAGRKLS